MLALFRNNRSTTVFILALYATILHLPAIIGWVEMPKVPETGDCGLLFDDLFGWATKNPTTSALVATVLVLFQALLVNQLADHFRLLSDRSWYPGAFYVLAVSVLPDFLFVSPALVAVTFIPIALQRIFSVYKQTSAFTAIFDSAFWVTLASLFFPPAVWCLPVAFLGLINLRSFSVREQVVFITGILAPCFIALSWYFWYDQAGLFLETQFSRWIHWPAFQFSDSLHGNIKTAMIGLLLLISILGFKVYFFKKLIQVQKYITIFYWFLFAGLGAALFHVQWRPEYFILIMPSVGIFLAYQFEAFRNKGLAEVFHLVLLGALFFIQLFHS